MKKFRIMLILMATLALTFLLTGCASATVDTQMTVNADMSGSRVITASMDEKDFDRYFDGTTDDLASLVDKYCPEEMSYTIGSQDGQVSLVFIIAFTDAADYEEKIHAILGEDAKVTLNLPDSVWSSGIYIDESYTSADLLAWLSDAMVKEEILAERYATDLFTLGDSVLVVDGSSYTMKDGYMKLDDLNVLQLAQIDILTELVDWDTYYHAIRISVPADNMASQGAAIRSYIYQAAEHVGKVREEAYNGKGITFICEVSKADAYTVAVLDRAIFQSEDCDFTVVSDAEDSSPFAIHETIEESLNLSNYYSGDAYSLSVRTFYKVPEGASVKEENVTQATGDTFEGYLLCDSQTVYNTVHYTTTCNVEKGYAVSNLNVDMKRQKEDTYKRVTTYTLDGAPSAEELTVIEDQVKNLLGLNAETSAPRTDVESETDADQAIAGNDATGETETVEADTEDTASGTLNGLETTVSTKTQKKQDTCTVTVTQIGDAKAFAAAPTMRTEVFALVMENGLNVKSREIYAERSYYGAFLANVTTDFTGYGYVKLGSKSKVEYVTAEAAQVDLIKGGKVGYSFNSTDIDGSQISISGQRYSTQIIIYWCLWGVAGLMILAGIVLALVHKFRGRAGQAPAIEVAGEIVEVTEVEQ